jgi:hypothetical protein
MRVLRTTILLILVACEKSQGETAAPEDTVATAPPKPAAEVASSCADRVEALASNRELPDDHPELVAARKECTMLYARCGTVDSAIAFARGDDRSLVLGQVEKCREAYCGEMNPKPTLCGGASSILTGTDAAAIERASLEFHQAMLAKDVGGDAAALEPAAKKLAAAWTRYGSTSMGGTLGDAASLGFRVKVTADGFELATETPHKWAAGGEAETSVKLPVVADKKKAKAAADPARWNYAALGKEAKALKVAFPEESTVTLVVDTTVPTEVQTRTMNALRGDGCKLEPDASPAKVPAECLFWRQILR